jgi:hypothetical protein
VGDQKYSSHDDDRHKMRNFVKIQTKFWQQLC